MAVTQGAFQPASQERILDQAASLSWGLQTRAAVYLYIWTAQVSLLKWAIFLVMYKADENAAWLCVALQLCSADSTKTWVLSADKAVRTPEIQKRKQLCAGLTRCYYRDLFLPLFLAEWLANWEVPLQIEIIHSVQYIHSGWHQNGHPVPSLSTRL